MLRTAVLKSMAETHKNKLLMKKALYKMKEHTLDSRLTTFFLHQIIGRDKTGQVQPNIAD